MELDRVVWPVRYTMRRCAGTAVWLDVSFTKGVGLGLITFPRVRPLTETTREHGLKLYATVLALCQRGLKSSESAISFVATNAFF